MFRNKKTAKNARDQPLTSDGNVARDSPSRVREGPNSQQGGTYGKIVTTVRNPFEPRQSNRVSKELTSDSDVWVENLAVVEIIDQRTGGVSETIRSYFVSRATNAREWDEPPSGASDVQCATAEMHEMAKTQLARLVSSQGGSPSSPSKKKGSLVSWVKRLGGKPSQDQKSSPTSSSVEARAARKRDGFKKQMKMAVALSLAEPGPDASGVPLEKRVLLQGDDDETVAMAKAISLSEHEACYGSSSDMLVEDPEDEMIRQAIEASKLEVEVASAAPKAETLLDFDFLHGQSGKDNETRCDRQYEDNDRKMPASYSAPQTPMQSGYYTHAFNDAYSHGVSDFMKVPAEQYAPSPSGQTSPYHGGGRSSKSKGTAKNVSFKTTDEFISSTHSSQQYSEARNIEKTTSPIKSGNGSVAQSEIIEFV